MSQPHETAPQRTLRASARTPARTSTDARTYTDSIHIDAAPGAVYDLITDIARTGEWSPICTGCWWVDGASRPVVGARFTGRNEVPDRVWETTSTVVAAEPGKAFAWLVGESYVRWAYDLSAEDGGTRLSESWAFLPEGIALFHERWGAKAHAHIENRTAAARDGIPATLAAIKRICESG